MTETASRQPLHRPRTATARASGPQQALVDLRKMRAAYPDRVLGIRKAGTANGVLVSYRVDGRTVLVALDDGTYFVSAAGRALASPPDRVLGFGAGTHEEQRRKLLADARQLVKDLGG